MIAGVSLAAQEGRPASLPEPSGRDVVLRIALIALLIRVALEIVGLSSIAAHGGSPVRHILGIWNEWDSSHYLRIAEVGYRSGTPPPDDPLFIVFFPAFPLAVWIVRLVVRDLIASGLVVSFAASVGAGWFLYKIVRLDADHDHAWRAVVLMFAFPTAYFMSAPYSEATFLFAVTAAVYAARTQRWARSGLAGAIVTGTRVTGVALAPALAVEALLQSGSKGRKAQRLGWVAFAGAGLAIYLLINQIVHGRPLHFLEVQRSHWYQSVVPPWEPIVDALRGLWNRDGSSTRTFIFSGRLVGFALALPLLCLMIRRLRPTDTAYAWFGFLLILSASWLISLPRYLLTLYPVFVVGSGLTRSRRVLWPIVIVGAAAQCWFFWRFSVGEWTF